MFKLKTSERLSRWRDFRTSLSSMPLLDAIDSTQKFWHSCPFMPYYLEPDKPETWPDPWQLISENYYCDIAKCLGILYTLHLSEHKEHLNPEIRVYFDPKTRYNYHIAYFAQGKYIVNLIEDEIVNKEHINQQLKLKYCYNAVDLKLEQY